MRTNSTPRISTSRRRCGPPSRWWSSGCVASASGRPETALFGDLLDHLLPLRLLAFDPVPERGRGFDHTSETGGDHALLHIRIGQHRIDLPVQLLDDRLRRAGRRADIVYRRALKYGGRV